MTTISRRYDADWLRVFATYLLFLFHVSKVFDVAPFYHIKNAELVPSLDLLTSFIHLWHMPLLFALAGWSLCASLRARGPEGMVAERIRRLFVPLVFGIVVLCPFIKYFELRSGMSMSVSGFETGVEFNQSFFAYLPTFFTGLDRFTWAHLWFLVYLFTFTMLYRKRCVARIAEPESEGTPSVTRLYRPLIALILIQTTLRLVWPGGQNLIWDWANFAYYSLYFLMGFEVGRNPGWERTIALEWRRAGGIGVASCVAMAVYLTTVLGGSVSIDPAAITVSKVAGLLPLLALSAVAGYSIIIALVGFSMHYLRRGHAILSYLSESSLPVYILHQAGIVIPGYYLLQLDLPIGAKFLLLLIVAVASTLAVYHFIVRPIPMLRMLFGMPEKRRNAARSTAGGPRRAATLVALAMLAILLAQPARAENPTVVGLWWADGGSAKVSVQEVEGVLRGTIVWLRAPFGLDGNPLRDTNHPDDARHEDRVIGIEMLNGFVAEEGVAGKWSGGNVYDPGNGRTYQGTITMDGKDRLLLRGFIGISLFGRTTTWFRVGSEGTHPRKS
jgi:glucan biosynthesis protein C